MKKKLRKRTISGPWGTISEGRVLNLKTLQVLYLSFSIYLSILSMSLSVYLSIYTMGSFDLSLGEKMDHFRPLEDRFYLYGPQFPLLLLKFRSWFSEGRHNQTKRSSDKIFLLNCHEGSLLLSYQQALANFHFQGVFRPCFIPTEFLPPPHTLSL